MKTITSARPCAGHPELGIPFGQDRLVPIFLATMALQRKSQTIRFRTAAEMLESFGMHTGGKEYRGLVGATIFFGTDPILANGSSRSSTFTLVPSVPITLELNSSFLIKRYKG